MTKKLLFILVFAGVLTIHAFASPPLTVSQTLPTAYINDSTGRVYSAVVSNPAGGTITATNVVLSLQRPATGFSFNSSSIITSPVTPYTVTGTNPVNISFTGVTFTPGSSVAVTYNMPSDCSANQGQNPSSAYVYWDSGSTTDNAIFNVNSGAIQLMVDPVSPLPFNVEAGQEVTVKITMSNSGTGSLFNIDMKSIWGTGFDTPQIVPGGNVTPLLSGNTFEAVTGEVPANSTAFFYFSLRAASCSNLTIDGSAVNPCAPATVYTDTAPPYLVLKEPNINITSSTTDVDYCGTGHVTVNVTNNDLGGTRGKAYNFAINANLPGGTSISNISPGWSYSGGTFAYLAQTVAANAALTLDFDLTPSNECAATGGTIVFSPQYYNACGAVFAPPVTSCTYSVINRPSIGIAMSYATTGGSGGRVFLGQPVTFTVSPSLTNPSKVAGSVVVTDVLPAAYSLNNYSVTAGSVIAAGSTFAWTMSAAEAAGSPQLNLGTTMTSDPCVAGASYNNAASVTATTTCGCALSDAESSNVFLQSKDTGGFTQTKDTMNIPSQGSFNVCDPSPDVLYQITLDFDGSVPGTFTGASMKDSLPGAQVYKSGTFKYNIGAGFVDVPSNSITSVSPLNLDMGFLSDVFGNSLVAGRSITFQYMATLTPASLAPCTANGTITSISDITIPQTAGGCDAGGGIKHYYLVSYVPVSRAHMGLAMSLNSNFISNAQQVTITANITKDTPWNDVNTSLTVDTANYAYLGSPVTAGFGGQTPSITVNPGNVVFTFASPLAAGQTGTITFVAVKNCTTDYSVNGTINYNDECGALCSASSTAAPVMGQQCDLEVITTPSNYLVTSDTITWSVYITNKGAGTAYNVHLSDTLKDIITYQASYMAGVTQTASVTPGSGNNIIGWIINSIIPNQVVRVDITAKLNGTGCAMTGASTVNVSYGWDSASYVYNACSSQTLSDMPSFNQLEPSMTLYNTASLPLVMCSQGVISSILTNTGLTHVYNINFMQDFMATGLIYSSGSAKLNGAAIADPSTAGSVITWTPASVPALSDLGPGQSITVSFSVDTNETFNSSNLMVSKINYQKPCERNGAATEQLQAAAFSIPRQRPQLDMVMDARDITAGQAVYTSAVSASVNDIVEWRVRVTNDGSAAAYSVAITDTLPANMSFIAISGPGASGASPWMVTNIGAGATATYLITAKAASCTTPTNNQAAAYWGCSGPVLSSPGTSSASAILYTRPDAQNVTTGITAISTTGGSVNLTFSFSGAPAYGVTVTADISTRFKVSSVSSYSSGLGAPAYAPAIGDAGSKPLMWLWPGPVTAGTYTITFNVSDNAGNCQDVLQLTPSVSLWMDDSCGAVYGPYSDSSKSYTVGKPDFNISKTPAVQSLQTGVNTAWVISVTNTGNADASNMDIIDTLGAGYTYVSAFPAPSSVIGQAIKWNNLTLVQAAAMSVSVTAKLNGGSDTINKAVVEDWNTAGDCLVNSKSAQAAAAGLSFAKTIDQSSGDPVADSAGEIMAFYITLNLQTSQSYKNIRVLDTLPNGLTYISDAVSFGAGTTQPKPTTVTGKSLRWDFADFTGSGPVTITITARAAKEGSVAAGTNVINNCETAFDIDFGGSIGVISFPVSLAGMSSQSSFIFREPSLTLTRACSPASGSFVTASQAIGNTITVKNANGANNSPAYNIRVTDAVTAGALASNPLASVVVKKGAATLVSGTDYNAAWNPGTGTITFDFLGTPASTLQKNEQFDIYYENVIDPAAGAGITVTNTANVPTYYSQVSWTAGVAVYTKNTNLKVNHSTVTSTFNKIISSPVSPNVAVGQEITYLLTFKVPAGTSAYDIAVADTMPAGLVFDSSAGPGAGSPPGQDLGGAAPVQNGQYLLWQNGTDITNTYGYDVTYSVTYTAHVANTAGVTAGLNLINGAAYYYNTVNNDNTSRISSGSVNRAVTVREPYLTIAKNVVSTGPYSAGSPIIYEVSLSNTSNATAYDTVVYDTLATGLNYLGTTASPDNPGTVSLAGQYIAYGIPGNIDISPGSTFTFRVTATAADSVQPGQVFNNTIKCAWTSLDGAVPGERDGSGGINSYYAQATATAVTLYNPLNFVKTIPSAVYNYTIGDLIAYNLRVSISEGTVNSVSVTDTLPAGLEFVSGALIKGNGSIAFTAPSMPAPGAMGGFNLNFGAILNPSDNNSGDDYIDISITARIKDIAPNTRGAARANSAEMSYVDGAAAFHMISPANVTITVTEAAISITKSVISSGPYTAGSAVLYKIDMQNYGNSTARDAVVYDTLPADLAYTGTTAGTGNPGAVSQNGNYLAWLSGFDIPAGSSFAFTVTATAKTSLQPGQPVTNSVKCEWTSLSGVSAYERTGSGVAPDNYINSSSAGLTSADSTSLAKTIPSAITQYTIGDLIVYRLRMSLNEGTTSGITVTDNLPAGLQFVSGSLSNGNGGISYAAPSFPIPGATGPFAMNFGTVADTADGNNADDYVDISVTARVGDISSNMKGAARVNSSSMSYTDGASVFHTISPANVTVTVAEAGLSITKTVVSGGPYTAGSVVLYKIDMQNYGNSTARDTVVYDTLPAELTYTGTTAGTGDPGAVSQSSNYLAWKNGFDILPGAAFSFTITATANTLLQPGQTITNNAKCEWTSLAGASAYERTGNGTAPDNYIASSNASLTAADSTTLVKTIPSGISQYTIGDTVTYRIKLSFNEGTTAGMTIADTLPLGLEFVSATLTNGNGGISYAAPAMPAAGSTGYISWNFGSVADTPDNITTDDFINLDAVCRVQDTGSNLAGVSLTNTARAYYTDGTGAVKPTAQSLSVITLVEPDLNIAKTVVSPGPYTSGSPVQYRIDISNIGTSDAHNVIVWDTLSSHLDYTGTTAGTGDPGNPAQNGQLVVWGSAGNISIAKGASFNFYVTATAATAAEPSESIGNSVAMNYTSLSGPTVYDRDGSGGINNYYTSATASAVTMLDPTSLTLDIPSGVTRYAVGETPIFRIMLRVPEGTLDNVKVFDTLPAGLQIGGTGTIGAMSGAFGVTVNSSPALGASGLVEWDLGNIIDPPDGNPENDYVIIQFTTVVKNLTSNIDGAVLSVNAQASYTDGAGTGKLTDQDSKVISVIEPYVAVTKQVVSSPPYQNNMPVVYKITLTNTGTATAYDTRIEDILMNDLSYTGTTPSPDNPGAAAQAGQSLTWGASGGIDIAPSGSYAFDVTATVKVSAVAGEQVTNTADVYWKSTAGSPAIVRDGSGGINDYHSWSSAASLVINEPLYIIKSIPSGVTVYAAGADIGYRLQAHVLEGTSQGVVVMDTLPQGLSLVSAVITKGNSSITYTGTHAPLAGDTGYIYWDLGTVVNPADGDTTDDNINIDYIVKASVYPGYVPGAVLSNLAQLYYLKGGTQSVTTTPQTTDIELVAPKLGFTKSVSDINGGALMPGDVLRYTLSIKNQDAVTAYDPFVTDNVPANTTYVPGTAKLNGTAITDIVSGLPLEQGVTVSASVLDRLNPGETAVMQFDTVVNTSTAEGTLISNQGYVKCQGMITPKPSDDPSTPEQGDSTDIITGSKPSLYLEKTAADITSAMGPVMPGDTIEYTLTLHNTGGAGISGAQVWDTIPVNTAYTASSLNTDHGSASIAGNIWQASPITLTAGETAVIKFRVIVGAVPVNTVISNQARAGSGQTPVILSDSDGNRSNGSQPTELVTGANPLIKVTKQTIDVNGGQVEPNDEIQYLITVSNKGAAAATNVAITDTMPCVLSNYETSTTLLNGSTYGDISGNSALKTGINLGTILPGASQIITYRSRVSSSAVIGDTIVNQASFTADGGITGISDSDLDDGIENGNDPANPNDDDPTVFQVGGAPGSGLVSGTVWFDRNHDNVIDPAEQKLAGWKVSVYSGALLIDTAVTDAAGNYSFAGLTPGSNYSIKLYHPITGVLYRVINNITVLSGQVKTGLNLPLDPTGVIYDSVTRQPIAGARVYISSSDPSFDPSTMLVMPAMQGQVTAADGMYSMILIGYPSAAYYLSVTPPVDHMPTMPSSIIAPHAGVFNTPAGPGTIEIAPGITSAPALGQDTTYYMSFNIAPGADDIVNNNIPVDPVLDNALVITKKAVKNEIYRGGIAIYTLDIRNTTLANIIGYELRDVIPPGFKYATHSAVINNVKMEPAGNTVLVWAGLNIAPGAEISASYMLIAGSGVEMRDYRNSVLAIHMASGRQISNIASAVVTVVDDPAFDRTLIEGKVFEDINKNGICDAGEPGIAGAHVVTVSGLTVVTDKNGKYHVDDIRVSRFERGTNFLAKVDEKSLPKGAVMTTDNPLAIHISQGMMAKANFGVSLPPVKKAQAKAARTYTAMFIPCTVTLTAEGMDTVKRAVEDAGSGNITITLKGDAKCGAYADDKKLAEGRVEAVKKMIMEIFGPERAAKIKIKAEPFKPVPDGDKTQGMLMRSLLNCAKTVMSLLEEPLYADSNDDAIPEAQEQKFTLKPHFDSGKADIKEQDAAQIRAVAVQINGEVTMLEVGGHTDNQRLSARCAAIFKDNPGLSRARAKAFLDVLVPALRARGIKLPSEDRIVAVGYGESMPVATNSTPEGMAQNRRVEIKMSIIMPTKPRGVEITVEDSSEAASNFTYSMGETAMNKVLNVFAGTEPYPAGTKMKFVVYCNYPSFADGYAVEIYNADTGALLRSISAGADKLMSPLYWDGKDTMGADVRPGTKCGYRVLINSRAAHDTSTVKYFTIAGGMAACGKGPVNSAAKDASCTPQKTDYDTSTLADNNIETCGSAVTYRGTGLKPSTPVTVNGMAMESDLNGNFAYQEILPPGTHGIAISATDSSGDLSEFKDTVDVDENSLFIAGIADINAGYNRLTGHIEQVADPENYPSGIFADGRAAFFLKGRIKGEYIITAQMDTGDGQLKDMLQGMGDKNTGAIFRRLDPEKYYPVYGDGSTSYIDVDTQGKVYLKVEKGSSYIMWGNYAVSFDENETASYSRALYGAKAVLNAGNTAGITAFAAEAGTLHGHDELRATGGSLYYLSAGMVVYGSEALVVEARDPLTGHVLASSELVIGRDYEIDWVQGRITMTRQLSDIVSTAGAQLYITADYEYNSQSSIVRDGNAGARAYYRPADWFRAGATIINEMQKGMPDYRLYGADAEIGVNDNTKIKLEAGRSSDSAAGASFSGDGGLTYSDVTAAAESSAWAYKASGKLALKDLSVALPDLKLDGTYKQADAGYSLAQRPVTSALKSCDAGASGDVYGLFGTDIRYTKESQDGTSIEKGKGVISKDIMPGLKISANGAYDSIHDAGLPDLRDALAGIEAAWSPSDLITFKAGQQMSLWRDNAPDYTMTTAAITAKIMSDLSLNLEGTSGAAGDSAKAGITAGINAGTEVYASAGTNRSDNYGRVNETTIGTKWAATENLKAYEENGTSSGKYENSISNTFGLEYAPLSKLTLSAGYTRSSINRLGTPDVDRFTDRGINLEIIPQSGPNGLVNRDVVSAGAGYKADSYMVSVKAEARFDRGSSDDDQYVVDSNAQAEINSELSGMLKFNWTRTHDNLLKLDSAAHTEAGAGLAYRPVNFDVFNAIARYTFTSDLTPLTQDDSSTVLEMAHIGSMEGILECGFNLQLGEKFAVRRSLISLDRTADNMITSTLYLWVNRLNYHIGKEIDLSCEYRRLWDAEAKDMRDGFLFAAYYNVSKNMKVGAGYNFTNYSDDLTYLDYNASGPFINVIGKW
jgi:uncharacterized repeat protein (TIGR01451 family)/fimbrial isopeptide formation D2 family protein